ncbi:MAG: hypothetical protein NTY01_08965 [Verrucomicrobia bacterium]|nr:hypothetical protein [Verrucomicrobiota bacterium]
MAFRKLNSILWHAFGTRHTSVVSFIGDRLNGEPLKSFGDVLKVEQHCSTRFDVWDSLCLHPAFNIPH